MSSVYARPQNPGHLAKEGNAGLPPPQLPQSLTLVPPREVSPTPLLPTLRTDCYPVKNGETTVIILKQLAYVFVCLAGSWHKITSKFSLKNKQTTTTKKNGNVPSGSKPWHLVKCQKCLGRPRLMQLSSAECLLSSGTVLRTEDTTKHGIVLALKKILPFRDDRPWNRQLLYSFNS